MRVVFMGTPEFAVPSLLALAAEHDVVAVYTRPDAASGRGGRLRPSPVKQAAEDLGIAVRQPRTLRDADEQQALRSLAADAIIVAAYGLILPLPVLESARVGAINVHASLLPRWRGAAPIQRAILAGDDVLGVSIMRMEEGLDTGPFCATTSTCADGKSTETLTGELATLGAQLLIRTLPSIADGSCQWTEQDESLVTYADKIAKSDVALEPTLTAEDALRRIRASSAQAPARACIGARPVTVLDARVSVEPAAPGAVRCTKRALLTGFADGALEILSLKPDGKSAMAGCDWARGLRLGDDATWSGC